MKPNHVLLSDSAAVWCAEANLTDQSIINRLREPAGLDNLGTDLDFEIPNNDRRASIGREDACVLAARLVVSGISKGCAPCLTCPYKDTVNDRVTRT